MRVERHVYPVPARVEVAAGGTVIRPGDAILADENGILALPPAAVAAVAARALKIQGDEAQLMARLHAGEVLPDISGASALVGAKLSGG